MNKAVFVARKAVVDSFRERHEIALFNVDAHPTLLQITNVKEAASSQDVANFFRVVNVLSCVIV